jgi:hypothetical protein
MVVLLGILLLTVGVAIAMSEFHTGVCPKCSKCPICGSELVELRYRGYNRSILAFTESDGFVGFLGCCRVELHDKVVDGVNYRGKVFVKPLFRKRT